MLRRHLRSLPDIMHATTQHFRDWQRCFRDFLLVLMWWVTLAVPTMTASLMFSTKQTWMLQIQSGRETLNATSAYTTCWHALLAVLWISSAFRNAMYWKCRSDVWCSASHQLRSDNTKSLAVVAPIWFLCRSQMC